MKEIKITIPDDYYIIQPAYRTGDTIKIVLQKRETSLPKSWEEFCKMFPKQSGECYIDNMSNIAEYRTHGYRDIDTDKNLLPDRATADAVRALCQLVQLRNAYNGDWVPDWKGSKYKYCIQFENGNIHTERLMTFTGSPLYFKSEELRDEFLRNFRPLIEKLKPLYGIKKGGEEWF